ncbi:MAG: hypothetical protein ACON5E_04775 [Flavobacteriales bacterium]
MACAKDQPILVGDNVAPPDQTIDRVVKENYINKLYISLLGREPNSTEFDEANTLLGSEVSLQSREQVIDIIQGNEEYYINLYRVFRQDYLNGVDTTQIRDDYIILFENLLENESNPFVIEEFEKILDRLYLLSRSADDLISGQANVVEIHQRCVNNELYDEINMGSFNYVVSIFQNFLHRYPTQSELENGIIMVDGEQSICFEQNGDSKNNFNALFFEYDGYYEGQIVSVYNKLLFRDPNTIEISELIQLFKADKDYQKLQKRILTTDEFLGIE